MKLSQILQKIYGRNWESLTKEDFEGALIINDIDIQEISEKEWNIYFNQIKDSLNNEVKIYPSSHEMVKFWISSDLELEISVDSELYSEFKLIKNSLKESQTLNIEILDDICDYLNSRSQDNTIDVEDLENLSATDVYNKIRRFCIKNKISDKQKEKVLQMIPTYLMEDRELSSLDGEPEYKNEFAIGDICLDYNDTEVKILNIGTYDEVIQDLSKNQLAEVNKFPVDDLKKLDKVYLVKVNKSNDHVPVKKGVYGIYPVNYDFDQYWGLESKIEESSIMSFTQFINESIKKNNFL